MDPDATLTRFLNALRNDDREEAADAILDLAYWIQRDGYLPADPREVSP